MASDSPEKNGHAYLAACTRRENQIVQLAQTRGIGVTVEIDPGRAPYAASSDSHQIQLKYGHRRWIVMVDHDTFMDDEFFKTLVLNHMPAAIGELAGFGNIGVALKKTNSPEAPAP